MRNDGQGIFRDARSAILFALNYRGEQFAVSMLGRLAQDGAIGRGAGLYGLDGSATAGIVRARMERLEPAQCAALVARHADVGSAPWLAAVGDVARFIGETEAARPINGVVLVASVRKFFGERQTAEQIAAKAGNGMHRVTAQRQWQIVKAQLERVEAEAQAAWSESLRAAGLT